MRIASKCPECGKSFKVDDQHLGKKAKCPGCGQVIVVQRDTSTPPPLPKKSSSHELILTEETFSEPSDMMPTPRPKRAKNSNASGRKPRASQQTPLQWTVIGVVAGVLVVSAGYFYYRSQGNKSNSVAESTGGTQAPDSSSYPTTQLPLIPENVVAQDVELPAKREFRHPFQFNDQKSETGASQISVETLTKDSCVVCKAIATIRTSDESDHQRRADGNIAFQFEMNHQREVSTKKYDLDWDQIIPATLRVNVNGVATPVPCQREDRFLVASVPFDVFASMLKTEPVEMLFDKVQFSFDEMQLEALRDLASRIPDGTSKAGQFVVHHEPDGIVAKTLNFPVPAPLPGMQSSVHQEKDGKNLYFLLTTLPLDHRFRFSMQSAVPADSVAHSNHVVLVVEFTADGPEFQKASELVIETDRQRLKFPFRSTKNSKSLNVDLNLEDLHHLVHATKIIFHVRSLYFPLREQHQYAIRQLASQFLPGPTKSGVYLISHEGNYPAAADPRDVRTTSDKGVMTVTAKESAKEMNTAAQTPAAAPNSKRDVPPVSGQPNFIQAECDLRIAKIDEAKTALKAAMIPDDRDAIRKTRETIAALQIQLKQLIGDVPVTKELDSRQIYKGQIGLLTRDTLNLSNLFKTEAQARVVKSVKSGLFLKIVGSVRPSKGRERDRDRGSDRDLELGDQDFLVVAGRATVEKKNVPKASSSDMYELRLFVPGQGLSQDYLKTVREAADENYEIEMTEEELTKATEAREANDKVEGENADEAKARRAKGFLDVAKKLIEQKKIVSAKSILRKAVAESPESEFGKEAAKLLKIYD